MPTRTNTRGVPTRTNTRGELEGRCQQGPTLGGCQQGPTLGMRTNTGGERGDANEDQNWGGGEGWVKTNTGGEMQQGPNTGGEMPTRTNTGEEMPTSTQNWRGRCQRGPPRGNCNLEVELIRTSRNILTHSTVYNTQYCWHILNTQHCIQ